jgi:hypothetical protein
VNRLTRLRGSAQWSIAALALNLACGGDGPVAPSQDITDPADAQLIATDIEHFWQAHDIGGRDGSTTAFQTR